MNNLEEYRRIMEIETQKLNAMLEALNPIIHRANRGIINCDELVGLVVKEFRDFGYEV